MSKFAEKNIRIMRLSPSSAASLHEVLNEIARRYSSDEDLLVSTDFSFQPFRKEGRLLVLDDNDGEIASIAIPEWADYASETFYDEVAEDLTVAIEAANTEGELERLAVWMPYSFVLVDEEHETVSELLLVDDDTLLVKKGLMAGLDEELDKFIEDLLRE